MTEDQAELIMEARDSIAAAKLLLDGKFPGYAASRSYYAMFYVAEALLEGEGLSYSKHSAVIAAFGREFARSGRVPAEYHRYLMEALELRHSGDYGTRSAVNYEQAQEQINRAEKFLRLAESLLGAGPT